MRLAHREPAPVGLQAPLEHECRLVLLGRDGADNVLAQSRRKRIGLDVRAESVLIVLADERFDRRAHVISCRASRVVSSWVARASVSGSTWLAGPVAAVC